MPRATAFGYHNMRNGTFQCLHIRLPRMAGFFVWPDAVKLARSFFRLFAARGKSFEID